jgi:hypothetical protein
LKNSSGPCIPYYIGIKREIIEPVPETEVLEQL